MGIRVFGKTRADPLDDCMPDDDCELCSDGISDGRTVVVSGLRADKAPVVMDRMEECICEACHKVFWRNADDMSASCPHCHAPYVLTSDLEEIDVLRPNETVAENSSNGVEIVEVKLVGDIVTIVETRQTSVDVSNIDELNPADFELDSELDFDDKNWQDSRKEQISLEMGSPEYKEYLEDLADNDPGKADDAMHAELEEYNQDLVTRNYDAEFEDNPESEQDASDDMQDLQVRRRFEKQAIHAGVMGAVIDRARSTESDLDDKVARSIVRDNPVMRDSGISADKYEVELQEYVMESAF